MPRRKHEKAQESNGAGAERNESAMERKSSGSEPRAGSLRRRPVKRDTSKRKHADASRNESSVTIENPTQCDLSLTPDLRILPKSSSTFASYRIPKKHCSDSVTQTTLSKIRMTAATSTLKPASSLVENEHSGHTNAKRKSVVSKESVEITRKRSCNSSNSTTEQQQTHVRKNTGDKKLCTGNNSPNSRPKLTAVRSKAVLNVPGPGVGQKNETKVSIDTPQMTQIKANIANRKLVEFRKKRTKQMHMHTNLEQGLKSKFADQITEVSKSNVQQSGTSIASTSSQKTPNAINKSLSQFKPDNAALPSSATGFQSSSANWTLSETKLFLGSTSTVDKTEAQLQNPVSGIELMKDNHTESTQNETVDEMDVDIVPSAPCPVKQLAVIFDTNVWIHSRNVIQEVLEMRAGLIIIPWMVLQEIDRKNKNDPCKTASFQKASSYIYNLLNSKHPRVKGQKADEAIIGIEFTELMADDSILNCAIQYSKLPQFCSVFVTNDVNLLNKALVHSLSAFKADTNLTKRLLNIISESSDQIANQDMGTATSENNNLYAEQNSLNATPSPSSNNTFATSVQYYKTIDSVMDVDDPMGEDIDNDGVRNNGLPESQRQVAKPSFDAVASALQQTLTFIILPRMIHEFGKEGWKDAIKVKPPFTIESGLKCVLVHWIAVFSYVFPSRGKEILEELLSKFRNKPGGFDEIKKWRLEFCQMAKVLFSLNNDIASQPRVAECCQLLQEFIRHEAKHRD